MKPLAAFLILSTSAFPQGPRGWLSSGGDLQRTHWNRTETELTKDSIKRIKLEWTVKLDSPPKELTNLSTAVVRSRVSTHLGIIDMVAFAGASDRVFVLDGDTGKTLWQKTLDVTATPQRSPSWLCPNALTATPIIAPLPGAGQALFVLASDGRLHAFNPLTGDPLMAPAQLAPAFSKMWSLNISRNIVYTTTSQGCNGVKSGVWGLHLTDPAKKSFNFLAANNGAGIWGRAGAAVLSDGRLVVETGDGPYDAATGQYSDTVLFLTPDLKLADYYTPANRDWITKKDLDMGNMGAVVFQWQNRELVAASGKEGAIFLLDAKSPGGADHRTPLYRSPMFTNEAINFSGLGFWGAMSTWESQGTRWLYAPAWGPPTSYTKFPVEHGLTPNGSVMAFKVEASPDGTPKLTPAWNSLDMMLPAPVIIANGIVFALADGDYGIQFNPQGALLNSEQRKAKTRPAILYALDATTGDILWSSGDTIKSLSHFSGLTLAGGRLYVATQDGTVYTFGLGSGMIP